MFSYFLNFQLSCESFSLAKLILYTYSRYMIFKKLWKDITSERPTFEDLVAMLDIGLQGVAGYLELEMVLISTDTDCENCQYTCTSINMATI